MRYELTNPEWTAINPMLPTTFILMRTDCPLYPQ